MTEQNFPLYEEAVSILKKRDKKLAWLMERVGPLSHTDLKDDFPFLHRAGYRTDAFHPGSRCDDRTIGRPLPGRNNGGYNMLAVCR